MSVVGIFYMGRIFQNLGLRAQLGCWKSVLDLKCPKELIELFERVLTEPLKCPNHFLKAHHQNLKVS